MKRTVKEIAEQSDGFKGLRKKDQEEMVQWAESLVQQSRNETIFKRVLWGAVVVVILALLVG